LKRNPKILLWAFSNTGGVRTFFNIYKHGFSCDFYVIRSINEHRDHSDIFCQFDIVKKNIIWYIFGIAYKIIPDYFYKLKSTLKIKSGVALIKNYFDRTDPIIATDLSILIILKNSGYTNITYYAQHDESLLSKTNRYLYSKYATNIFSNINLITNSSWLKNIYLSNHNLTSEVCIPGVDYKNFSKRSSDSYKEKPQTLLALARPQAWKGTKVLIEAFNIVQKRYKDLNLILFGSFDIDYTDNDNISFIKNISDTELINFYKSSDLTINPSFYESSPGPVIESLSCGTPVISTKIGVEDINYFQSPDTLFKEKDKLALSSLLIKLIESKNGEYKKLCNVAYQHEPVSWDATVENLYHSDIFPK
tara:strand:- start:38 stop:1126 length:1089 start_codon:yes stop_codon:yes gene_type:complete